MSYSGAQSVLRPAGDRHTREAEEVLMRIDNAAELIRLARQDIGMSPSDLARATGVQPMTIAAYESGWEAPRAESLDRLLAAARMRPSIPLSVYADAIRIVGARYHLTNIRVFGSAARGEDDEHSDIDLLVTLEPEASLFDLGGFADAVEDMTGFTVDLLTDGQIVDEHFAHVREQAVPL